MEFITENYIWFIVGGIIIVMAIIGYIAEKTDFGKKEKENIPKVKIEKVKKEKPKKEPKVTKVEAKGINDLTNDMKMTITEDLNEEVSHDIDNSLNNTTEDIDSIDPSLFAPLEDIPTSFTNEEKTVETPTEDNLNDPFVVEPVTEEVHEEENSEDVIPQMVVEDNIEEKPVEIPEAVEDTTPVAEEEDIWKF